MSGTALDQHPYFTVNKAGVIRDLPVQLVGPVTAPRPVGVSRTPKVSFPQPVALGDTGARRNYDIDEFELATFTEGMGEDTYPGHTPPASFAYGTLETRYPDVLSLRTKATQLGGPVTLHAHHHAQILELGQPEARLLLCGAYSVGQRLTSAGAWTPLMAGGSPIGTLIQGQLATPGAYVTTGVNLFRSTDGVTWTQMGKGAMVAPYFLAQLDNRLWVLNVDLIGSAGNQVATLYQSTDIYGAAAGGGTWTAGTTLLLGATEAIVRLFLYVDPNDNQRPTLWLLTERRLFFLDYYVQTPTWQEWFVARRENTNGLLKGWATVHPKNAGLYASFGGYNSRWVWEFIGPGRTVTRYSPNAKGGYPFAEFGLPPSPTPPGSTPQSPWGLWADNLGLYVFGGADEAAGGTNEAVTLMSDPGAFHSVWGAGASGRALGGGLGRSLWVAALPTAASAQALVWELPLDGQEQLPQHAQGRVYERPGAAQLVSAWIHCGYKNTWKNLRYIEVDCITQAGNPGLDTGRLTIAVRTRHGGVTTLGVLNPGDPFPAVVRVAGGLDFKECQVIVGIDATVGPAASSPFLRAIKLGYRPRPKQRYSYAIRADLRDECPAFQTADGLFRGQSAASLRLFADELGDHDDNGLPDPMVGLSYGGQGNPLHPRYRSAPECEVLVTGQESPDGGDGLYLFQFNDVSAPVSG